MYKRQALDLNSSFTFVWCPGNVCIEEPDAEPRNPVDSPRVDAIAVRADDAKRAAISTIINVWQQTWNTRQRKLSAVRMAISRGSQSS